MLEIEPRTTGNTGFAIGRPINVLLLEDSAYDRCRIERLSRKTNLSLQIKSADSIQSFSERMDEDVFDLIFVDYRLPEADGLQALEMVRYHNANKGAATIMISGDAQTEIAVSALKRGCSDFIQKDTLSAQILQDTIISALRGVAAVHEAQMIMQEKKIRRYVTDAISEALRPENMQPVLAEGLRLASRELALEDYRDPRLDPAVDLKNFASSDEFVFRFLN